MSFAEKMHTTSVDKKAEIEAVIAEKIAAREANQKERVNQVRDQLFSQLTAKYHDTLTRGIYNAARNGKQQKFINFAREDFKANCSGMGFPHEVKSDWLSEMCNPDSKYLPVAEDSNKWWAKGEKMHFQGIDFKVWNNKAFTVVFTW